MSVKVDIKALLESGVHFGHKTSRWHPKMAPYIHSKRQDSHIIDLVKTVEALDKALPELTKIAGSGRKVLFVGTKKQAKDVVRQAAEKINQPYVVERWIGGMLTNGSTITQQIKKLKNLEKRMASGDLEKRYNKLEVQRFQEEIDSLNIKYGGIKDLMGKPGAVVVVDALTDANAVREAQTLGVPVFAIVDTNVNPTGIDYVIPGNDDAIKGVQLLLDYFTEAVAEGAGSVKTEEKPVKKRRNRMGVSVDDIKKLRELTGVGLTDAKKALVEADGDFDKALEEMRKKGLTKAEKKGDREAREGLIESYVHSGRIGVIVEVNCETDFVARLDDFKTLAHEIAMQIAAMNPKYASTEDIPAEEMERVKAELMVSEALASKPEEMREKIVTGQLNKHFAEQVLMSQTYILDDSKTVEQHIKEAIAKLGENIVVRQFKRIELGVSE
ncbi:30S ribosomal protein S2 [Candidatus Nanosynbacter featherlites]|uniref:Multifunctional fusion protein n=1 Tax=Candidatus Nanosynbacter featherlites TaxID=2572088 RepID=A0A4P9A2P7_9BACT|nr:30S ribosomal protein S2 [Candidatus Nanosynbacter featherlites]QCT42029.1 30S ribosomal protein S2 [Candidatus Nanosynbacter featherlites]